MDKEERLIQIPLQEYKELLEIKGKYEELKSQILTTPPTIINWNGKPLAPIYEEPYKVTCMKEGE